MSNGTVSLQFNSIQILVKHQQAILNDSEKYIRLFLKIDYYQFTYNLHVWINIKRVKYHTWTLC